MSNPRQLVQYDTRTNTITDDTATEPTITTDIRCHAQGWVQKNEFIYMIPQSGTHLAAFNLGILCLFCIHKNV